jgi:hypothetical protein
MRAKRRLIAGFRLTFAQICIDLHIVFHPFGLALFVVSSSGAIGC